MIVLIPDLCILLYFHTNQQCKILATDTVAMTADLRMSLCQTAKACFLVANPVHVCIKNMYISDLYVFASV